MILAFLGLMIWQSWQVDYGPKPETPVESVQSEASAASVPPVAKAKKEDVPVGVTAESGADTPQVTASRSIKSIERIKVSTDVYNIEIDSQGGDLRRVDLIQYPVSLDQPDHPYRLLDDTGSRIYMAQTGLLSGDGTVPNHHALFRSAKDSYVMGDGQNELAVDLVWQGDDGLKVIKSYVFTRGSYDIKVNYRVENGTGSTWNIKQYRQFQRSRPPAEKQSSFVHTYTGGAIWSEAEHYEKIKFDDMDDAQLARDIKGGWAAMIEHYFVSAWVPQPDSQQRYFSKALGNGVYALGMVSPSYEVAAGSSAELSTSLYIGPKIKDRMDNVAPTLHLTIDYGWLTVISEPLFWVLDKIHDLVGNWGWAIIILTIMIKASFYKLSEASYKSMANMRKVTPKLQALKERYGDDKQKLNQAMMDLYKKEKINPLGGCLPIAVQIPVFIALYWALLESVQLRQAPWILWINDLSTMDPYYILPIIMGVSMLVQQKLNPAPMDPMQAKIMMALPLVFTVFFAFFPSGLVIYWVVNNLLSITQQWYITRKIEAGEEV